MNIVTIKQGQTLNLICTYNDDNNNPMSLEGIEITSRMRVGVNKRDLYVNRYDQNLYTGKFSLVMDYASTQELPIGKFACDIVYTTDGVRTITDTFFIQIVKGVSI